MTDSTATPAAAEPQTLAKAAADAIAPNWPMLVLIAMLPLQNLYLGKIPSLGAGLNFINICLLGAIYLWRTRPEFRPATSTTVYPAVYAFIAMYVLSALWAVSSLGFLPTGHFASIKDVLTPVLLFFIVLHCVRDKRGIIYVLAATMFPLPYMFRVFYAQYSDVASWHYSDAMRTVKGTFMMLGSNELMAFYAAYSFMLIALLVYIKHRNLRYLIGGLLLLNLYSLLYGQSRGGWLAFLIAGSVLLWRSKRSWLIGTIVFVALFGGVLVKVFPVSVQERFNTIFVKDGEKREESAQSRFELWDIALKSWESSPLIGIGYNVFHTINWYENKDTHNYFVKILTEQGLVGIWIVLMLFWRVYYAGDTLWRTAKDPLYKAVGMGFLGCVLALVVGNLFGDRFSHYPLSAYFWVYLALTLRALQLNGGEQRIVSDSKKRRPVRSAA